MLLILGSLPKDATSTEAISIMKEGTGFLQPRVQNAYRSISVKGTCPCHQGKSHPFTMGTSSPPDPLAPSLIFWRSLLHIGRIPEKQTVPPDCSSGAVHGEDVYTHSLSVTAVCLCCQVRHLALRWLPAALIVPTNGSNPPRPGAAGSLDGVPEEGMWKAGSEKGSRT